METIHTTEFATPVGRLRAASSDTGLAFLALPGSSGGGFHGWLRRCAPDARKVEALEPNRDAIDQIQAYLEGERADFDLVLDLRGTPFQLAVWAALSQIPYGETCSYTEVAGRIGRPKAVRAVGTANGANPIPLVVPCHRVINAGGTLGGYGGGLDLKRRLLAMERSHQHPGDLL